MNMYTNTKDNPEKRCVKCGVVLKTNFEKGTGNNILLSRYIRSYYVCNKCMRKASKHKIITHHNKNSKVNVDKFCVKCGVLLNPKWDGGIYNNIAPARYKNSNYVCNGCVKKSLKDKK